MTIIVEKIKRRTTGGRRVVDGVSLNVQRGEVVSGDLNINGAGKRPLSIWSWAWSNRKREELNVMVMISTTLPIHMRSRLGVGYLPQEASIFRKLTVADNLRVVLEFLNLTRKQIESHAANESGMERPIRAVQLSGGERRRLEIPRCSLYGAAIYFA